MLKRIVPTPGKLAVSTGGLAVALMANTSLSGSANGTALFQFRPSSSRQAVPSNRTISPTSGCGTPAAFVLGGGSPPGIVTPETLHGPAPAPPSHTRPGFRLVVRFPEWNAAA